MNILGSKLQNYLNFFLSRAEISRIRPSVFKCQILKYFVSLLEIISVLLISSSR